MRTMLLCLIGVTAVLFAMTFIPSEAAGHGFGRNRIVVRSGGGLFGNRNVTRINSRGFAPSVAVNSFAIPQQAIVLNQFSQLSALSAFQPSVSVRTSFAPSFFPVQSFSIVQPGLSVQSFGGFGGVEVRSSRCGF